VDKEIFHKVFFWGSLIPAIVHVIWNCVILCVIYDYNPNFYVLMANRKVDANELIRVLSVISEL
jgi:tyrosine-specific transport protein